MRKVFSVMHSAKKPKGLGKREQLDAHVRNTNFLLGPPYYSASRLCHPLRHELLDLPNSLTDWSDPPN